MKITDEMREASAVARSKHPGFADAEQLLADPKTVIGREFGVAIPDNMVVVAHESNIQPFSSRFAQQPISG